MTDNSRLGLLRTLSFRQQDLDQFRDLSGDKNPLHLDADYARKTPYGRQVVFGTLGSLMALRALSDKRPIASLDMEFRKPMFLGWKYQLHQVHWDEDELRLEIRDGDLVLLVLTVTYDIYLEATSGFIEKEPAPALRDQAADWHPDHFQPEQTRQGRWQRRGRFQGVDALQSDLLMLASYLVGMECPGKRALFSSLRVKFHHCSHVGQATLDYKSRTVQFDRSFALLSSELEVVLDNLHVASAQITSFVRPELPTPAPVYGLSNAALQGQTALVVGGSRGLGARLVETLTASGSDVWLNYMSSALEAQQIAAQAPGPGKVHLLAGDAADPKFWQRQAAQLPQGLDLLVLNACAPPVGLPTGAPGERRAADFIRQNLALATAPTKALLPKLEQQTGTVLAISSVYAVEGSASFPHYAELKRQVEAYVAETASTCPNLRYLVARPPVLRTQMSSAPGINENALDPAVVALQLIEVYAEQRQPAVVHILDRFSEKAASTKDEPLLVLGGSFTLDPILPALNFWREQCQWPLRFEVAPYHQEFQLLLNANSAFHRRSHGLNLLVLRFEDWLRDHEHGTDERLAGPHLERSFDQFTQALSVYRRNCNLPLMLLLCPSSPAYEQQPAWSKRFAQLSEQLEAFNTSNYALCHVVIAAKRHQAYGVKGIPYDAVADEMGHIPFPTAYFHVLATLVSRHYHSLVSAPLKVVASDCDNTLWEGVVGEAGVKGLSLAPQHLALQHSLAAKQEQGLLLTLVSKNNEDDVFAVFKARNDMPLKREHIVDSRVNWARKSGNLAELAASLNLGLDSFLFIDDNPVEIAEVRHHRPEVVTLQFPDDAARALHLLEHLWILDRPAVTAEDRSRTQMYQAEQQRRSLRTETNDFANFIESLGLIVEIDDVSVDDWERASQLTQRTNQFNTTTRRCDPSQLKKLRAQGVRIIGVHVEDRFGSYGLVGLLLLKVREKTLVVENLALSCRVLGRGVEHQLLAFAAQEGLLKGCDTVVVAFEPSAKNQPARDFLNSLGTLDPDDAGLTLPAAELAQLQWQASSETGPQSETPKAAPLPGLDARAREQLIERIVALGNIGALEQALSPQPTNANPSDGALTSWVFELFARVLALPVAELEGQAPLERYVRDSFKRVELTVALKQVYPQLPTTFLFEQHTLADICDALSRQNPGRIQGPSRERRSRSHSEIAIIGMAGRFPGAPDTAALWRLLREGRDAIAEVPADRWDVDRYFSETLTPGKTYCRRGGFMENVDHFDAAFFHISPKEAELMDPQQRLLLEVVWNLLEDAATQPEQLRRKTGVFVGVNAGDYGMMANVAALGGASAYRHADYYQLANRISYFFDLKGQSLTLDTACSSSGTALFLACESIRSGFCDSAIAAGINLFLHPSRFVQYAHMRMISPSGRCSPFGDGADGTLFGEGAGALLLKPLDQALAAGDPIHAVIKACAINSGGKTNGFTVPNPRAQADLVLQALEEADLDPATISYVEAHGTGTPLGDPIEVRGLSLAYAERLAYLERDWEPGFCALGSLKANIGHLEAAAAIPSTIKVLLQMRYKTLVPSLNARETNPKIDFADSPFRVQQELAPWQPSVQADKSVTPRRAAVSSFGAGGANAHLILEEPACHSPIAYPSGPHLYALSAHEPEGLRARASALLRFLQDEPHLPAPAEFAYTLQTGRVAMDHRLALVAADFDELSRGLQAFLDGKCMHGLVQGKAGEGRQTIEALLDGAEGEAYRNSLYASGNLLKLATLWLAGVELDWNRLHGAVQPRRVHLPHYSFRGERFWLPESLARIAEGGAARLHPLLDAIEARLSLDSGLTFSKSLSPSDRLLAQHRVNGSPTLPGVAYLAIVQAAVSLISPNEPLCLQRVTWTTPFAPSETCNLLLTLAREQDALVFRFTSQQNNTNLQHCQGRLAAQPEAPTVEAISEIEARCPKHLDHAAIYARFRAMGIDYHTYFQGLERVCLGDGEVLGYLRLPTGYHGELETLSPHPSIADAALQTALFLFRDGGGAAMPFAVGQVICHRQPTSRCFAHATRRGQESQIQVYDDSGQLCLSYQNFSFREGRDPHEDFYFLPRWQVCLAEAGEPQQPRQVLIIHAADTAALAISLAAQHRAARCELWALDGKHPIPKFNQAEALGSALRELAPDCIYFLSGIAIEPPALDDFTGQRKLHQRGTLALFQLASVLPSLGKARLVVVTANTWKAEPGKACPQGAAQHGIVSTLARETSRVETVCLDLALEELGESERMARFIVQERPNHGQVVLWRKGIRFQSVIERKRIEGEESSMWRQGGTYLILGGRGGIGRTLARHLASVHKAQVALIGRRPCDPEFASECEQLRRLGGDAGYFQADASQPEQLEAAVAQIVAQFGPIHGAVHSAIVLADKTLSKMDEETFEAAYAPKFLATLALHRALRSQSLDFMLFLSSINSFTTPAGQGNYSAGCLFKDAFADALNQAGLKTRCINWGYWGTVGIVATDHYRRRVTAQGFQSIAPELGMEAIERLLVAPHARVAAVKGDSQLLHTMGVLPDVQAVNLEGDDILTSTLANLVLPEPDVAHAEGLAQGLVTLERLCAALALGALQRLDLFRKKSERLERAALPERIGVIAEYRQLLEAVIEMLLRVDLLRGNGRYLALGSAAEDPEMRFYIADPERAAAQLVRDYPQVAERLPLLLACMGAFGEVLTGKRNHVSVVFPGGSLHLVENIYKTNPTTDYFNRSVAALVVSAAKAAPSTRPFRVLEVGAGTGGTAAWVLPALAELGRPLEYVYTDISPRFLRHGQETYGHYPFISFHLLDMEKSPEAQGFEPASFDIVLGTNCIHATSRLDLTLSQLKRVLYRGGLLIVNEFVVRLDYNTLTFGLTSGWWLFRDRDVRIPYSPLLRVDQWLAMFDALGYVNGKAFAYPQERCASLGQVVLVVQSDGQVSLPRPKRLEERAPVESVAPSVPIIEQLPAVVAAVQAAVPVSQASLRTRSLELLRGVFATVLRIQKERIEDKATFDRLGIDSLISLEIVESLEKLFGELSDVLLFEYDTLAKLAEYLQVHHADKLKAILGTPKPEPKARPSVLLNTASMAVPEPPQILAADPVASTPHSVPVAEPIAIIGMAGRFAKTPDLESLWQNLVEGRDCIGPIPAERWSAQAGHPPNRWGGFIDDVDRFEASFFNIPPNEAAMVDPAERLFLETSWTALEDACTTPEQLVNWQGEHGGIGVFAGCMYQHYALLAGDPSEAGRLANNGFWSIANRVSFFFDFKGPSMATDTACSSGLSALHLAVSSLREGGCAMALAGSINLTLIPDKYINLARLGMLGSGPHSKSLGAGDGLMPAEGVGVLVLKPLSAAERDGDPIWGVVRATAVNHGGRTSGFTVPNPSAHGDVAARALAKSGVPIESINYIEVAANGSALGDPIEISGLTRAFRSYTQRKGHVAMGAVKSNLGHSEAASGMAQMMKVVLQMRHRWLVPSLHAQPLNPSLKLEDSPFYVVHEGQPWENGMIGEPLRASVNAYGAGGSNAHVVVEAPPSNPVSSSDGDESMLFTLSARNEDQLRAYAARIANFLESDYGKTLGFADVVHSFRQGRQAMAWRLAVVAENSASLVEKLSGFCRGHQHLEQVYAGKSSSRNEPESEDTGYFASLFQQGKLGKAGRLWVGGIDPDWSQLTSTQARRLNGLPTYPFAGSAYWVKSERAPAVAVAPTMPKRNPKPQRRKPLAHGLDKAELREQLFGFALAQIAEILGLDLGEIDRAMDMNELGLDSIHLNELAQRIGQQWDTEVHVGVFFGFANLGACLSALWQELEGQISSRQDQFASSDADGKISYDELDTYETDDLDAELNATIERDFAVNLAQAKPVHTPTSANTERGRMPIAVVGMSGKLPQSADLDEFWENLLAGKELAIEVPDERWNWRDLGEEGSTPSRARWGAFLDQIDQFDPFFFGISPSEAGLMDPQQRLLLEVAWQTIENAGYAARDLAGSNTGVFVAACNHDYDKLLRQNRVKLEAHSATGTMVHPILANRISYLLDLRGPSEIIDTACSSSLVALHRAISAIRAGECNQALVGGVNLLLHPEGFVMLEKAGILSSDGHVRLFHNDATGYVRGEGVVAVLLKPLAQAEADRDHIYGVLRGSATNHDGKSYSMTAPNPTAQEAVVKSAFQGTDLDPASIDYIEAQGTGSPIGDPVEARALHRAYTSLAEARGSSAKNQSQALGYLKPCTGHLESTYGLAALVKVLLAMRAGIIPGTPLVHREAAAAQLKDSPLYVACENKPWPIRHTQAGKREPKRAAIHSFGFGGVNAHLLLEEYLEAEAALVN